MMLFTVTYHQAPVPLPSYQRGEARRSSALHINALTLIATLHLLVLCRLAHRRCPPPLPAGSGGAPRTYREETLLLIDLLMTSCVPVFRLSFQDMHDWLKQWPALALACRLPLGKDGTLRIPSPAQQCKHRRTAGAPLHNSLFVLTVLHTMRRRLVGARDLIIDSLPILAWRRRDPDAAFGHAPAQHPRPLLLGYRVHTLLCRGSGLLIFFLLS